MIQLLSGMLASAVHVVTGPDHLAAVTPLAIESKRKAWVVGVFWGLGHITGMIIIGVLFYLFRDLIDVDKISAISERMVGIVLIVIGIWALYKVYFPVKQKHKHPHFHEKPEPHVHIHSHEHENEFDHTHRHNKVMKQGPLGALLIGTLHGLAGISHFLLVLPTLTLPTRLDAGLYLTGFAAGTLVAMGGYALIIGILSTRSSKVENRKVFNALRLAGGILAIGVGIWWLFQ
jgi:ABC-type nickel/cobalt efflux system permease component RcnA